MIFVMIWITSEWQYKPEPEKILRAKHGSCEPLRESTPYLPELARDLLSGTVQHVLFPYPCIYFIHQNVQSRSAHFTGGHLH